MISIGLAVAHLLAVNTYRLVPSCHSPLPAYWQRVLGFQDPFLGAAEEGSFEPGIGKTCQELIRILFSFI